jgi:hypothetical protein
MRPLMRIFSTLAVASLASCATTPLTASETAPVNFSAPNETTDHFIFGDYTSSAWISDSFNGEKTRQFKGKSLHYTVTQTASEGGIDIGLSRVDFEPVPVAQAKSNLHVCSAYITDLSGKGRWWAGPKISVNWQGDEAAKQNGDDWYENYIVEIASSTPDELHDIFTGDYFKAEELPSTRLAGADYRHYKIRFHSWWQFWSVRQDYRESGILPVEPILDVWIEHGLPSERIFDGVKANIETYGNINGTGTLRMDSSQKGADILDCD